MSASRQQPSRGAIANLLRCALVTLAFQDRAANIRELQSQPNPPTELINRMYTEPVKRLYKVQDAPKPKDRNAVHKPLTISLVRSAAMWTGNEYGIWVSFNELSARLRDLGFVVHNHGANEMLVTGYHTAPYRRER